MVSTWIHGIITLTSIIGKDETLLEKFCSILVQLEYKYQVDAWNDQGVLFKERLYVPKIHPETKSEFL